MCSINGFSFADSVQMKKMISVQNHRGPDGSALYTDNNVTLGHTRLSILDRSTNGRQPMICDDGTHVIVYNGEVYNFKELQDTLIDAGYSFHSGTDTEVVLNAFKHWGVECLNRFNGMFAFCIYNAESKSFFLARDRMGIKPLYYHYNGTQLIFSSEIKAILEHPIERRVNIDALNHLLAFRYNSSQHTLFQGIHKLSPGHWMRYDCQTKSVSIHQWWDIKPQIGTMTLQQSAQFLDAALLDSTKKRLISDVPVGVYLSGGIDSSAIVAYMSALNQSIKSFSVDAGDNRFKDIQYANKVAEHFQTDHTEIRIDVDIVKVLPQIVYHQDEPLADPAALPMYLMSQKVRPKAIVVLNGAGGDELFGGYSHYPFLTMRQRLGVTAPVLGKVIQCFPASAAKLVSNYFCAYGEKGKERIVQFLNAKDTATQYLAMTEVISHHERAELLPQAQSFLTEYKEKHFNSKIPFMQQVLIAECKNFLVENVLMLTDKVTMASSLEARVPLLDHNVVHLAFQTPTAQLMSGGRGKIVLKHALKHRLPKYVLTRKKQGFYMPIDTWLEKDIKGPVQESIQSLVRSRLIKSDYVTQAWNNYSQSPLYYARQLWTLYTLSEWQKMFMASE